jgi:hypothetical protein
VGHVLAEEKGWTNKTKSLISRWWESGFFIFRFEIGFWNYVTSESKQKMKGGFNRSK